MRSEYEATIGQNESVVLIVVRCTVGSGTVGLDFHRTTSMEHAGRVADTRRANFSHTAMLAVVAAGAAVDDNCDDRLERWEQNEARKLVVVDVEMGHYERNAARTLLTVDLKV